MKFLINLPIQSVSDVITNSSSELYLVNGANNSPLKDVHMLIEAIESLCQSFYASRPSYETIEKIVKEKLGHKGKDDKDITREEWSHIYNKIDEYERDNRLERCSGMGGDLDIWSVKEAYDKYVAWCKDDKSQYIDSDTDALYSRRFIKSGEPVSLQDWFLYRYCYTLSDEQIKNADMLILVDIDRARYASIDYLKRDFSAERID